MATSAEVLAVRMTADSARSRPPAGDRFSDDAAGPAGPSTAGSRPHDHDRLQPAVGTGGRTARSAESGQKRPSGSARELDGVEVGSGHPGGRGSPSASPGARS